MVGIFVMLSIQISLTIVVYTSSQIWLCFEVPWLKTQFLSILSWMKVLWKWCVCLQSSGSLFEAAIAADVMKIVYLFLWLVSAILKLILNEIVLLSLG